MEEFWNRNKGIILGVTIAVILLITGLQQLIIGLVLIVACGFIGNYFYYIRSNKNITIKASTINELHQKVINKNLEWGVINLTKAKRTLGVKLEHSVKIKNVMNTNILAPLPEEIENDLKKFSKGTSTGFAWVSKTGEKYSYLMNMFSLNSASRLMQALGAYANLGLNKHKTQFLNYIEPGLKNLSIVLENCSILKNTYNFLSNRVEK